MASKAPTIRYAHSEGLTQICYDASGKYLASCGYDGKIRIWKGIDDDEPSVIASGEMAYGLTLRGDTMYVASDNHSVDRFTFPTGEPDGILARFTGNVTYLDVSESRKYVAAGSSDFDIKIVNVESKKQKCYLGHQAPILCVAVDPMDEFLASTSCDGNLKIWEIESEQCIKTIAVLTPSNDIENSESQTRICWRPATGEDVAVPTSTGVSIFTRVTWAKLHSFTTDVTSKPFQCCAFSLCGRFIAAASADGWLVVWDAETQECLRKLQHPLKSSICSVMWNPLENNSLAFSDSRGQVGVLENVILSEQSTKTSAHNDLDALFEEDDDNMIADFVSQEAEEDNMEVDLTKLKKKSRVSNIFCSDDESDVDSKEALSRDLPAIPSTLEVLGNNDDLDLAPPTMPSTNPAKLLEDDDASSVATGAGAPRGTYASLISMQPAFQPGSTPVHLSHRFMVWNAVGIVRAYNDDTENAIDIEFHDAKTHHALHLTNHEQYTLADLSDKAAVLATESTADSTSKLKGVHFSSWDNNKDWTVSMPDGEEIKAVAIGENWLAACTSALHVRLFSLGGTQRQMFSISGPVVAMAAHTDQLLIVYHITQGFGSNQNLGFMLLEVGAGNGCRPRKVVGGQPLPISFGSTLTWLGFTAEGTPATVDSEGSIRLMNREFCYTWVEVASTKKMSKSRHDNHWVVGLHENPQQIRCIMCKGSLYPATLPRPTLAVQPYKMPLCEMDNDRGKLEEEYWRTKLLSSHGNYLTSRGYEPDPEGKQKSQVEVQQLLMRLFALCCKTDQEFRALEICSLMPTSAAVNLAIKYSSRIRKILLAQRLQEVAQEKLQEEHEAALKEQRKMQNVEESEEEEEDFRAEMQAGYSATETEWSNQRYRNAANGKSREKDVSDDDGSDCEAVVSQQMEEEVPKEKNTKPMRSLSSQLAGSRRNPFKKSIDAPTNSPTTTAASSSGSVLDGIKRSVPTSQRRTSSISTEATRKSKGKNNSKKQKTVQPTLFNKLNLTSTPKPKRAGSRTEPEEDESVLKEKNESAQPKTSRNMSGVQLFIEEKLSTIEEENPEMDGIDARKLAIQRFRSLSAEGKKEWNDRAKSKTPSSVEALSTGGKRKRDPDDVNENSPPEESNREEVNPAKSQKVECCETTVNSKLDTKSRLSAFAFTANE
ncbi:unnamed protein product [Clavelina lepadiformis]|uniref:WD repeat and HMG-box DNA-binding protein 1 n=1 Tax=Clavelina lepadiformis TaxID=159417 RepID=A0ABP0FF06_CLALP